MLQSASCRIRWTHLIAARQLASGFHTLAPSPYQTLGVSKSASIQDIKIAFRKVGSNDSAWPCLFCCLLAPPSDAALLPSTLLHALLRCTCVKLCLACASLPSRLAPYMQKAKELHPDTSSGQIDTDSFFHIVAAYELLSDPQKRQTFDAQQQPDVPDFLKAAAGRRSRCACHGMLMVSVVVLLVSCLMRRIAQFTMPPARATCAVRIYGMAHLMWHVRMCSTPCM